MSDTTDTEKPQTPNELLADLGEFHMRTLVSPLPKQPAALGWQCVAGSMAAGFARALHALNEADPGKAAEITDWFQGPFEEGPDPEEHTDWLERIVAKGDLDLMEKWVQEGRRLAESSKASVEAREAKEQAAFLREHADQFAAMDPVEAALAGQFAWHNAAAVLRKRANELEFAATPCDGVPCEPGGEPCSTHERLLGHYEGMHELCGSECGATA